MELEKGMQTPWGIAEDVKMLTNGIFSVHTSGHGGYAVDVATLARLCNSGEGDTSRSTVDLGNRIVKRLFVHRSGNNPYVLSKEPTASFYWFEEDCDWAILCLLIAKNGSPAVKEAYFHDVGEREKEMIGAAWCTVQHFHPELQEDLKLI